MPHAFAIDALRITPHLAAGLANASIVAPTPIQQRAIPAILAGQDVLVQSCTGTGKTLAYLLPLLQRAQAEPEFVVVIVAPSPELAMQIVRVVESYKSSGIGHVALVGGGNLARQKDRLKKHPQVMVGTPGRVVDLILQRKIKTARIGALVLDETDVILAPENAAAIYAICSRPEFKAQIICASATLGDDAMAFAQRFMAADRCHAQIGAQPLSATIRHTAVALAGQRRETVLLQLLQHLPAGGVLVFVNKLYNVPQLYQFLSVQAIRCDTLSSERHKQARQQAVAHLQAGATRVVIATDAAARGLDIKNLDWVIHFDVPRDAQTYLHRAGRSGRAGRLGHSMVLTAPHENAVLQRYAGVLQIAFDAAPSA